MNLAIWQRGQGALVYVNLNKGLSAGGSVGEGFDLIDEMVEGVSYLHFQMRC